MYVCLLTYVCIYSFYRRNTSLTAILSQRNNQICSNHCTILAGAQFSPCSPNRLLGVACSSVWLPHDQLCHFISYSPFLMPGEVISNDGFYA